tara:strand:- start:41 stop:823 length:783 start_codon:yes stop_codon:yes gene_type:complete
MPKRNRQQVQDRRDEKKEKFSKQEVKPQKFQEERKARVIPLTAKNESQKKALKALSDKQCVVMSGSSGVGKSTLAVWWACTQYLKGNIDNIVFTRGEKGLGATPPVPGNDTEKMLNMCLPMLLKAKEFLGVGILKNNLCLQDMDFLFSEVKGFMVFPMSKLGGMSFDARTVVICDEAQAADVAQIKALATRPEGGCQVIICGDTTQTPHKGKENGLAYLERKMIENPYHDAEIIKFTTKDCCRDGWTAHISEVFEKDGVW